MAIVVSLLFLAIAFVIFATINGGRATKKSNEPPSPSKLPIIGNLHQLVSSGSLLHHSLQALSNKHGPLMLLHLGNIPTLVVSSAEMAEEVLKNHDVAFAGRPLPSLKGARQLVYDCTDIAFATYGEYWKKARKICVSNLLSAKRVQSFELIRQEEVANMIEEIKGSCSVDLSEVFPSLTSGILSRTALGKKYVEVKDLAKEMEFLLGSFSAGNFFPWLGWIDVLNGLESRLKRFSQGMDSFLDQMIHDHLISKTYDDQNDNEQDLVDVLLHLQNDTTADLHLTKDNLKAIILDMFIAGIGFTAVSLEWAMAELVKNPRVMDKAQAEIRRVIGTKAKVEEDDIVHMDYLKCIIKESLRLHPPGPFLFPHETTTSVRIQGYRISPKTKVLINAWAIGRDPRSWENPDEFLPERFAHNPTDFKGQDFQLIPFGAGRRICPGISFAITTIELAFVNLLYWFDWELPRRTSAEDVDMSETSGIVARRKSPLHLVPTIVKRPGHSGQLVQSQL